MSTLLGDPAKVRVYPVVHWTSTKQAVTQAELALTNGADGVFLIDMDGRVNSIKEAARLLISSFPDKLIGGNFLALTPGEAISHSLILGLNATWLDNAGVTSEGIDLRGVEATDVYHKAIETSPHAVFAACAFKYQKEEPDPETAARLLRLLGWVPTTSGPGTGMAAKPEKIIYLRKAIPDWYLGLASGVTPDNVQEFIPHANCILVATGIEKSFGEFDLNKLRTLVEKTRSV